MAERRAPEEIAREIVSDIDADWSHDYQVSAAQEREEKERVIDAIALALTQVEKETIERCARVAEECRTFDWRGGEEWAAGYVDGKNTAAQSIRRSLSPSREETTHD